mmetsp:Transcript_23778/g.47315  ORF Transcript_23778/g.47315 Transcript_23778/m.47315 type:complete len:402 (-) Transcript_23778:33-1238(-)
MIRVLSAFSAITAVMAHGETGFATWDTLCDAVELTFNGDAEKYGSSGRLVKLAKDEEQSGSMFFSSKLDMSLGGEIEFTFNIDAPADGLAIVLQSESRYALGEKASGMGFYGLQNGVAIEIDGVYNEQWGDPEPSDDDLPWHVEVHHSPSTDEPDYLTPATKVCDGHGCTTNWLRSLIVDLADGEDHVVNVQFPNTTDPDADYHIKFAIDGGTASFPSGDYIMFGPLDQDWFDELDFANMYVGITAGTGGDEADVYIKSLSLQVPLDNTECFTGFDGDDCSPTIPDNACTAYEHCGECTSNTFCCGWDDDADISCAAVSEPDDAESNLVNDMCAGYVDPYAETTEHNDDSSALDILGVLVAVLAVAVMTVNYFGRQRVMGTLRGSYGPLAEDSRASLTETL